MKAALESKDINTIIRILEKIVLNAISFYDTNKKWSGYIFELKRAKTQNLENEAEKALKQIEEKKYDTILINEGIKDIIKIGLVFDGKKAVAYY